MADLYGKPLIYRLVDRVSQSGYPVVVCTSTDPQDTELAEYCHSEGVEVYRGHPLDVMDRFINVADKLDAETIVRVTGDNPLTDPEMIVDMGIAHNEKGSRYTYTKSGCRGIRPEIIDVESLRRLHTLVDHNKTEYMTYMLEELYPQLEYDFGWASDHVLTVDTPEDLERMQSIYNHYQGEPPAIEEVISWLNGF